MGVVSHDFRNIAQEVEIVAGKITEASQKYPQVKFRFCESLEAFRSAIYGQNYKQADAFKLELSLRGDERRRILNVETSKGSVFGPQPFLAVKLKSNRFIHDNFDFDISLQKWSYTFDCNSIRADDLSAVGVAANDQYGNTFIEVINI